MVIAQLFFGRNIPGRAPLTDVEWSEFAAEVVSREFPDGFTTLDAEGRWRDAQSGTIIREPTKVLWVAIDPGSSPGSRLDSVMAAYRQRFNQVSVGVLTTNACGAF